jgi:hypothetical protein
MWIEKSFVGLSTDCFSADGDQCLFIYQDRKDQKSISQVLRKKSGNSTGVFKFGDN